ncbi:hypothetical protein B0H13DRAFT_2342254 [Mycena leptocephala]|nr:hypothetical protein B0H13DRAFT_2342254 [Mycena leptocephala]
MLPCLPTDSMHPKILRSQYGLKLGSIEEILTDKSALRVPSVDKYKLEPFHDGMLLCELHLVEPHDTKSAPPVARPGLTPRIAADTIRSVRDRHVEVVDAIALLRTMGWNKSRGGYQVPWTYEHSLYNMDLRIGHAVAGTDKQTMALAEHCPDASAWYKSPDDDILGLKFNDMKIGKFKTRMEDKKQEAIRERAKAKHRGKEAKARKQKRAHQSEDESSSNEMEAGPSKRRPSPRRLFIR